MALAELGAINAGGWVVGRGGGRYFLDGRGLANMMLDSWTTPFRGRGLDRLHDAISPFVSVRVAGTLAGVVFTTVFAVSVPGHWGMLDVQPHPLLAMVLLIALLHGNPSGYIAGFLAALSYTTLVWLRPESSSQPPSGLLLIQPIALVILGWLIGHEISASRFRVANAESRYERVSRLWRSVDARHRRTSQAKADLESRLMQSRSSTVALCDLTRRLQTLGPDELYPAILDISTAFFNAASGAVYITEEGVLKLRAELPSELATHARDLSLDSGAAAIAVARRKVVMDPTLSGCESDGSLRPQCALMVGPLIDENGLATGVVMIRDPSLSELTTDDAKCFGQILGWASLALQKTSHVGSTEREDLSVFMVGS